MWRLSNAAPFSAKGPRWLPRCRRRAGRRGRGAVPAPRAGLWLVPPRAPLPSRRLRGDEAGPRAPASAAQPAPRPAAAAPARPGPASAGAPRAAASGLRPGQDASPPRCHLPSRGMSGAGGSCCGSCSGRCACSEKRGQRPLLPFPFVPSPSPAPHRRRRRLPCPRGAPARPQRYVTGPGRAAPKPRRSARDVTDRRDCDVTPGPGPAFGAEGRGAPCPEPWQGFFPPARGVGMHFSGVSRARSSCTASGIHCRRGLWSRTAPPTPGTRESAQK